MISNTKSDSSNLDGTNNPDNTVLIFTDGSSRGNPGRGGWGFVAVYPNSSGEIRIDEQGGFEPLTTNNRMELMAVIKALSNFNDYYPKKTKIESVEHVKSAESEKKQSAGVRFVVHLDSSYVLKGATEWMKGWKAKNWISSQKEEVKNRDLWELLDLAMFGKEIKWMLLPGHAGVYGNERCDVIATASADQSIDRMNPYLYSGSLAGYFGASSILNLNAISEYASKSGKEKASGKNSTSPKNKLPAYSYVSAVGGKVMTHSSWDDCKKRVAGVSGAKYKKATSKENQENIISEFKN